MKTLWEAEARQSLLDRLKRLKSDAPPRWGKMNCARMLAHLADSMRMATGELETKPKGGPLRFAPLRHLIIYWLPFPKGAPTAPELIARPASNAAGEAAAVRELIARLAAQCEKTHWPEHPAFGKLSAQDWGVLTYKHIDHHLRQFGV